MNRRLRQRHRLLTAALAVVVPVVFAAGLLERPEQPLLKVDLPAPGPALDAYPQTLVEYRGARIGDGDVTIRILGGPEPVTRFAIEFAPEAGAAVVGADVLAYWSWARTEGGALPDDATLIGPLGGAMPRLHELPVSPVGEPGYLYFYSRAMNTLIADPFAIDTGGHSQQ